jgi:hypothetical protein
MSNEVAGRESETLLPRLDGVPGNGDTHVSQLSVSIQMVVLKWAGEFVERHVACLRCDIVRHLARPIAKVFFRLGGRFEKLVGQLAEMLDRVIEAANGCSADAPILPDFLKCSIDGPSLLATTVHFQPDFVSKRSRVCAPLLFSRIWLTEYLIPRFELAGSPPRIRI